MTARADVVIPVYRGVEMTRDCLTTLLECSGTGLGTVIIVHDCGPEAEMLPMLRALRDAHPQVRLLENEQNLGFVESCNRGLSLRQGHAAVLNNDTLVTRGWLDELLAVLEADPRIAAVCPLSNNATLCSAPDYVTGAPPDRVNVEALTLDSLPQWTEMPTPVGFCLLLRDEVLNLVGGFDPAFGRGYHEENDWAQRAQARGYVAARANRAFVYHLGAVSFGDDRSELDLRNGRRLVARYPTYLAQNQAFDHGPHARVAAIGVRAMIDDLRVCVELSDSPEPDWLGPLANEPKLRLQVIRAGDAPRGEIDVLHRVGGPRSLDDAQHLLTSRAHLVVTWSDVFLFRSPHARPSWAEVERARAEWTLLLEGAQAVVVPTAFAKAELARVVTRGAVTHVPHAIAPRVGARSVPGPDPVLVHLGSTHARDNESLLLDAFALARARSGEAMTLLLEAPERARRLPEGARRASPSELSDAVWTAHAAVVLDACSGDGARALSAIGGRVPVVALNTGGIAEVVGGAGVLVENPSIEALATALLDVCDESMELSVHSDAVLARHAPKLVASRLAAVYRECALRPDAASLDARARLSRLLRAR